MTKIPVMTIVRKYLPCRSTSLYPIYVIKPKLINIVLKWSLSEIEITVNAVCISLNYVFFAGSFNLHET